MDSGKHCETSLSHDENMRSEYNRSIKYLLWKLVRKMAAFSDQKENIPKIK